MKEQNILDKILDWIFTVLSRFNCEKGRHQWCYTLSESGRVYLDEREVPPELWHCRKCGINKPL